MAYKITDECIRCGSCDPECPNTAISSGLGAFAVSVEIDPEKCTECVGSYESSQCELACAMSAIGPDPEHQESREQLLEKWKKIHPGETPAVT